MSMRSDDIAYSTGVQVPRSATALAHQARVPKRSTSRRKNYADGETFVCAPLARTVYVARLQSRCLYEPAVAATQEDNPTGYGPLANHWRQQWPASGDGRDGIWNLDPTGWYQTAPGSPRAGSFDGEPAKVGGSSTQSGATLLWAVMDKAAASFIECKRNKPTTLPVSQQASLTASLFILPSREQICSLVPAAYEERIVAPRFPCPMEARECSTSSGLTRCAYLNGLPPFEGCNHHVLVPLRITSALLPLLSFFDTASASMIWYSTPNPA